MMEIISSPKNPRVAAAWRLRNARERRARGEMLLEGPHVFATAVDAGVTVRTVFALPDDDTSRSLADGCGADWVPCTETVLGRLGSTENPRGPIAVAIIPTETGPLLRDVLVAHVNDPGNAGTLIRSAAALGFDVVFPPGAVDVWSPKVLRAAAGCHFLTSVRVGVFTPSAGIATIATVVRDGVPLPNLIDSLDSGLRWAVLIGSEPHGLSAEQMAGATIRVSIPMPGGAESLNAAVAGSIVAYQLACWRSAVGGPTTGH